MNIELPFLHFPGAYSPFFFIDRWSVLTYEWKQDSLLMPESEPGKGGEQTDGRNDLSDTVSNCNWLMVIRSDR